MTRANNHVDVILWSRVSSLTWRAEYMSDLRASARTRGRCVRAWMCTYLRRYVRVQKGDAKKCACGANGGECNATRVEPAAECSSEPNSEVASSLGYCAQKQERREEVGRKRGSARNGSHREVPLFPPPGEALYHRGHETRCRSAPGRRYDPPFSRSIWEQKISFIFRYLNNTGGQNTKCI